MKQTIKNQTHPPVLNGCCFTLIKLPSDKAAGTFSTQRIVQMVISDGESPATFVTENDYIKPEMNDWFNAIIRKSFERSLAKQDMILCPVKLTLHWRKLMPSGLSQERYNPETGEVCE